MEPRDREMILDLVWEALAITAGEGKSPPFEAEILVDRDLANLLDRLVIPDPDEEAEADADAAVQDND